MPAEKGKPKKKYPQVGLTQEVYRELWDLKFDLRKNSLNELVDYLIKEHKGRLKKETDEEEKSE